jgi:hypothetical protein
VRQLLRPQLRLQWQQQLLQELLRQRAEAARQQCQTLPLLGQQLRVPLLVAQLGVPLLVGMWVLAWSLPGQ